MLEKQLKTPGHVIYVVYPGDSEGNSWRVQAIPVSESAEFDNRCNFGVCGVHSLIILVGPLPEEWRGKRDEELSKIAGVKDATFVHATGFIGGAKTKEETISMAVKSLEIAKLI